MTPAGKFLGDWMLARFLAGVLGFILAYATTIMTLGLLAWLVYKALS